MHKWQLQEVSPGTAGSGVYVAVSAAHDMPLVRLATSVGLPPMKRASESSGATSTVDLATALGADAVASAATPQLVPMVSFFIDTLLCAHAMSFELKQLAKEKGAISIAPQVSPTVDGTLQSTGHQAGQGSVTAAPDINPPTTWKEQASAAKPSAFQAVLTHIAAGAYHSLDADQPAAPLVPPQEATSAAESRFTCDAHVVGAQGLSGSPAESHGSNDNLGSSMRAADVPAVQDQDDAAEPTRAGMEGEEGCTPFQEMMAFLHAVPPAPQPDAPASAAASKQQTAPSSQPGSVAESVMHELDLPKPPVIATASALSGPLDASGSLAQAAGTPSSPASSMAMCSSGPSHPVASLPSSPYLTDRPPISALLTPAARPPMLPTGATVEATPFWSVADASVDPETPGNASSRMRLHFQDSSPGMLVHLNLRQLRAESMSESSGTAIAGSIGKGNLDGWLARAGISSINTPARGYLEVRPCYQLLPDLNMSFICPYCRGYGGRPQMQRRARTRTYMNWQSRWYVMSSVNRLPRK